MSACEEHSLKVLTCLIMFHVPVPRERAKEYLRRAIQELLLSRTQMQDAGRFQIPSQDDLGNWFEEFRQK